MKYIVAIMKSRKRVTLICTLEFIDGPSKA